MGYGDFVSRRSHIPPTIYPCLCYHRGMAGRPADWARWLLILGVVIGGLRLLFGTALPILPNAFAWGGAVLLGTGIVFLLLPFPHEATLDERRTPPRDPDRVLDG